MRNFKVPVRGSPGLVPVRPDGLFFGCELLAVQEKRLLGCARRLGPNSLGRTWHPFDFLGFSNSLCRPAHALAKQILNQPYQTVGVEGLGAENHIQPLVGGLGIGKAAEHDHG